MSKEKINFEDSLLNLEKIVAELEKGDCSLDKSIELFEKGMKHINECKTALKNAETKIIDLRELESLD